MPVDVHTPATRQPRVEALRVRATSAATSPALPTASIVVTSEEPPEETKGSGTPMTGSMPMTEPMLIIACPRTHVQMPAVATRIAGIPRLIQDGRNGFLCDPGDLPGLTQGADPGIAVGA